LIPKYFYISTVSIPWNAAWYLFPADLVHLIMSTAFDLDLEVNVSLSGV